MTPVQCSLTVLSHKYLKKLGKNVALFLNNPCQLYIKERFRITFMANGKREIHICFLAKTGTFFR